MKLFAHSGIACLFACGIGLAAPLASAAETVTYTFVSDTLGNPGRQVVKRDDDGLYTVTFTYKNNGRGPDLAERYRLAPDGSFQEYHVNGRSTMGAVIDEHFERTGSKAAWQSTMPRATISESR